MSIDLKKLSRKELEKLGRDVEKQLERLRQKELKALRSEMEKLAAAHGVTLEEAMKTGTAPKRRNKPKSAPKYANPADNSQTWTGRGRKPEWFKAALKSGMTPEKMEL
ncbi:MAG: H-NS histone family protein [Pseudomonadota bacterium]